MESCMLIYIYMSYVCVCVCVCVCVAHDLTTRMSHLGAMNLPQRSPKHQFPKFLATLIIEICFSKFQNIKNIYIIRR